MKSKVSPEERQKIFEEELAKKEAEKELILLQAHKEYSDFIELWSNKHNVTLVSTIQIINK